MALNNAGIGITSMENTATPVNQVRDILDFPHSGLIKSLFTTATGNYAVKNGAAGSMGFNLTFAGGTSPTVTVAAGAIFREGKYTAISVSSAIALTRPASGNFYHLVVVNVSNALAVRLGTTADKVPNMTLGDIPVALIRSAFNSDTSSADLLAQFFTSGKEEQSCSIGYSATNKYNEAMSITSDGSGATTFENKATDQDMTFKVSDGGVSTEVLRLDGATARVGINEASPDAMLHLKSSVSSQPEIRLENINADDEEPCIRFMKNSGSAAVSDDLGLIRFEGDNSAAANHLYAYIMADTLNVTDTTEAGRMKFYVGQKGIQQALLTLNGSAAGDSAVVVNEGGYADVNFRVESDTEDEALFIDAGANELHINKGETAFTTTI